MSGNMSGILVFIMNGIMANKQNQLFLLKI
jgi:hypothetical protein